MEITLEIILYYLRNLHPEVIRRPRKNVFFIGAHQFVRGESQSEDMLNNPLDEMQEGRDLIPCLDLTDYL